MRVCPRPPDEDPEYRAVLVPSPFPPPTLADILARRRPGPARALGKRARDDTDAPPERHAKALRGDDIATPASSRDAATANNDDADARSAAHGLGLGQRPTGLAPVSLANAPAVSGIGRRLLEGAGWKAGEGLGRQQQGTPADCQACGGGV